MSIAHRSDRLSRALITLLAAALAAAAMLLAAPEARAAAVFYSADASATSSTLFATGDRRLDTLGFKNSSTTFTGANFLSFAAGSLTTFKTGAGLQTFTWNQPIGRDMTKTASLYSVNPDRADHSTPFLGEANATATLAEVFGPFTHSAAVTPYKNMSYLLDAEEGAHQEQILTLLFPQGMVLSADSNPGTIELAWLERGGNSDINVRGILAFDNANKPILTAPLKLARSFTKKVGWSIDDIEIPAAQNVAALGVSLDAAWKNLLGFRFTNVGGGNGPDTVAIGTALLTPSNLTPIPEPTSAVILAAGALGAALRRRAKKSLIRKAA